MQIVNHGSRQGQQWSPAPKAMGVDPKEGESWGGGFFASECYSIHITEQSEHCDTLHRLSQGHGYEHGHGHGLISSRICNAV